MGIISIDRYHRFHFITSVPVTRSFMYDEQTCLLPTWFVAIMKGILKTHTQMQIMFSWAHFSNFMQPKYFGANV